MKYYLVASTTCALVGIEQCTVFVVGPGRQAAFERQYKGRILMVSTSRQALPPCPAASISKGFGPFSTDTNMNTSVISRQKQAW